MLSICNECCSMLQIDNLLFSLGRKGGDRGISFSPFAIHPKEYFGVKF
ncbi:hypothetical protein HMPREF1603_01906 [Escherichia coli 907892]|nr:hypothetical protein HMPREF1603_01906 [Escherichia coli 907892]ESE27853.1 hypothetical protein HMPREF1622_04839 [Escherichia coli A35218R]